MSNEGNRAAEAPTSLEQKLRLLVEMIPALVWSAGPEGNIEYVNKRVLEYLEHHLATSLAGDGWKKSTRTTSHSRQGPGSKVLNPEIPPTQPAECEERTAGIGGSMYADNHCEPAMARC
jgi:PAS domain-containing protein